MSVFVEIPNQALRQLALDNRDLNPLYLTFSYPWMSPAKSEVSLSKPHLTA